MPTAKLPIKYIRVISDVHLDGKNSRTKERTTNYHWLPQELDTDAETLLIVAGDVGDTEVLEYHNYVRFFAQLEHRFARIVYVTGNHEHCGTKFPVFNVTMKEAFHNHFGDRVVLLDNELIEVPTESKTLLIAGTTLWTSFCKDNPLVVMAAAKGVRDFHAINGFSTTAAYREHQLAMSFLELVGRYLKGKSEEERSRSAFVVVSHFAPLPLSGHARFATSILTDYFCNDLSVEMEGLAEGYENLWIHGHTHSFADYSFEKWRVVCNPVGYDMEHTGYQDDFVIPVSDLHQGIQEIVPADLDED